MPELYGPLDSLEAKRKLLEERRARLLAAARRATPMPEGQMVSGHYVPPSWTQYLPGLADKFQQGVEERGIDEATLAQGVAEKAALRDSLAQLSGTEGRAEIPPNLVMERPEDQAGVPGIEAVPAPTGADRRAIIAQLMSNPAAGTMGQELLKDDLISAPIRAEARQTRQQEQEASRLEKGEQLAADRLARAELAKQRSEDLKLTLAQREQAAREHNALMRELAAMRISAQRDIASLKGSAEKPAKPLPHAVHKELSALEDTAGTMSSLASTFKPEYSGPSGWVADKFGPYWPGASDETATWWKNYRKQAELTERHALFGAALTPGEQASWRSADIAPGMKGETIKKNLDTRKALADKLYANAVDRFEKGGHSNVRDVFNPAAVRSTGGASGGWDSAAKPAPAGAVEMLKRDPSLAPAFKAKYGYLPGGQ